jgi:hypothetical protein
VVVQRDEVHARPDAARLEPLDDLVPADPQPVEVEADHEQVPGMRAVGRLGGQLDEVGDRSSSSSARESWAIPSAAARSVMLYLKPASSMS